MSRTRTSLLVYGRAAEGDCSVVLKAKTLGECRECEWGVGWMEGPGGWGGRDGPLLHRGHTQHVLLQEHVIRH